MRLNMSKQPPPAPTASAIGPCPTVIKIIGRPGTGSLPSTIAPPDHPFSGIVPALCCNKFFLVTSLERHKVSVHISDLFNSIIVLDY